MEPRLLERGEVNSAHENIHRQRPSMEPRLLERGETGGNGRMPLGFDPSMEPRLLERGEEGIDAVEITPEFLQWSRAC